VQAQIQALQEQFTAKIERFTLRINDLALRLNSALLRIKTLQNRAYTSQRKLYLPNVNKFDGVLYYFNTWLLLIKAKLFVNKDAFSDLSGISQFYYVYL
jgi:hypothetical protein